MISVALCTYNGEKFIEEQVQSILRQTKAVDEIVVCDDGSKDVTLEIVRKIAEASVAEIRIYTNDKPLGVKENFRKAIELCMGDYVFLSDQDDIWLPHKVETIMNWFDAHPNKSVVFTDAYLVDENRVRYEGRTQFQGVGFRKLQQEMFMNGHGLEVFMMANRATGATMAFRKADVQLQKDDWGQILHDEYIAVKALLNDQLGMISEPLIEYRQHAGQQVGSSLSDKAIESEYGDWYFYNPIVSLKHIQPWRFEITERLCVLTNMLHAREEMRHSILGVAREIMNIGHYRIAYGPYWERYIKYDSRKSFGHLWHKIIGR